jgi:hypothetical protein
VKAEQPPKRVEKVSKSHYHLNTASRRNKDKDAHHLAMVEPVLQPTKSMDEWNSLLPPLEGLPSFKGFCTIIPILLFFAFFEMRSNKLHLVLFLGYGEEQMQKQTQNIGSLFSSPRKLST